MPPRLTARVSRQPTFRGRRKHSVENCRRMWLSSSFPRSMTPCCPGASTREARSRSIRRTDRVCGVWPISPSGFETRSDRTCVRESFEPLQRASSTTSSSTSHAGVAVGNLGASDRSGRSLARCSLCHAGGSERSLRHRGPRGAHRAKPSTASHVFVAATRSGLGRRRPSPSGIPRSDQTCPGRCGHWLLLRMKRELSRRHMADRCSLAPLRRRPPFLTHYDATTSSTSPGTLWSTPSRRGVLVPGSGPVGRRCRRAVSK